MSKPCLSLSAAVLAFATTIDQSLGSLDHYQLTNQNKTHLKTLNFVLLLSGIFYHDFEVDFLLLLACTQNYYS